MSKFTTILFDVDGTLLDFDKTEKEALENTFSKYGIEPTKENFDEYMKVNSALWKLLEEDKINKDKLKVERFRQFFDNINLDKDFAEASEVYIDYLSQSYFLIDGAYDICSKLKKSHNIAIVTNGIAKVQHSRLELSGLKKIFKHIFISDEIGFAKPKKEYFDYVFDNMTVDKLDKVIIVGDSLSSDIKGGNSAGIATCWYNPNNLKNNTSSICNYVISSLNEIEGIVT